MAVEYGPLLLSQACSFPPKHSTYSVFAVAGKFISTLLLSMTAMLQMETPHINVLSKVDQVNKHADRLRFGLDYYTEVLDLEYLLDSLQQDPFTAK